MDNQRKHDFLLANMFKQVPEFMEQQIAKYNKVLTTSVRTPEYMRNNKCAMPVVSAPTQIPCVGSERVDRSSSSLSEKGDCNGEWRVVLEKKESGPLRLPDAIVAVLQSSSAGACVKNESNGICIQREFLKERFRLFTSQLESNLFQ